MRISLDKIYDLYNGTIPTVDANVQQTDMSGYFRSPYISSTAMPTKSTILTQGFLDANQIVLEEGYFKKTRSAVASRIQANDVLMTMRGVAWTRFRAVWLPDAIPAVIPGNLSILRPIRGQEHVLRPSVLAWWLSSAEGKKAILSKSTAGRQDAPISLTVSEAIKIYVPVPPERVQEDLENLLLAKHFVDEIEDEKSIRRKEITDAIMTKYLMKA